jgi:hypothetical protein
MILIRNAQLEMLSKPADDLFIQSAIDHIFKFSPATCTTIGIERVRKTINYCLVKATRYGFTTQGQVLFFLDCMYSFGSEFDSDPTLAWASEVLRNTSSPDVKSSLLYERMVEFTTNIYGNNHGNVISGLETLVELFKTPQELSKETFEYTMLTLLYKVFPARCVHCGDQILRSLIQKGVHDVDMIGIDSLRVKVTVIFLMLFVGHGVLNDTIYYWIGETLKNKREHEDSTDRSYIFEKTVSAFLDKTLAEIG